jgi:hypothetical protein
MGAAGSAPIAAVTRSAGLTQPVVGFFGGLLSGRTFERNLGAAGSGDAKNGSRMQADAGRIGKGVTIECRSVKP